MASENDLAYLSAVLLLDLYRRRGAVAGRGDPADFRSARRAAVQDQCVLRCGSGRRVGCGARIRGALVARRSSGAARRRAGDDQGSDPDARHPDPARLAPCRARSGLVGGCARDGPVARGGRGNNRQDHDAGIRLESLGRQPANRDNPQSLGPLAHARRQQRRGGGGLCRWAGTVACRQRWCRLDPHPERLYRRLRIEAELWPSARPSSFADGPLGAYRADDANRRRRGLLADRSSGPRPSRPLCSAPG